MVDLKNCPFCGSDAIYGDSGSYVYGYCVRCGAQGGAHEYDCRDDAANSWNKRVVQSIQQPDIVDLVDELIETVLNDVLTRGGGTPVRGQPYDPNPKIMDLRGKLISALDKQEKKMNTNELIRVNDIVESKEWILKLLKDVRAAFNNSNAKNTILAGQIREMIKKLEEKPDEHR